MKRLQLESRLNEFEKKWLMKNESANPAIDHNIRKELNQFKKEANLGYIDAMDDFESLSLAIISIVIGANSDREFYSSPRYKTSMKALAEHLRIVWEETDGFKDINSIPVNEFYQFISPINQTIDEDIIETSSTPHYTIAMDVNKYSRMLEEMKKLEAFVENYLIDDYSDIYEIYHDMVSNLLSDLEGEVSDPVSWEDAIEHLRGHQLVDFYYEFTQILEDAGLASE